MSDLISRSELIKQIVNRTGSETVLFNSTEELNAYLTGCAYKKNQIIDMVMNQPTAYDVEKVSDEINMNYRKVQTDEDLEWNRAISRCDEIVRKGGVQ